MKTTNVRYTYLYMSQGKFVSNNQNFYPDLGGNYVINRVFSSYYSDVTSPGKPSADTRGIEMQPFGCSHMAIAIHLFIHLFKIKTQIWVVITSSIGYFAVITQTSLLLGNPVLAQEALRCNFLAAHTWHGRIHLFVVNSDCFFRFSKSPIVDQSYTLQSDMLLVVQSNLY